MSLPSHLDIGTTYTRSRIRCNAEGNGYTGLAESKAESSYDMFPNLSTTRTDGGWMYFKINNDDYTQLPGSGNKVNIYKDTTTSGNLDVGKVLTLRRVPGVSDTSPLNIIYESPGGATGISYQSTASGQGFLIAYATAPSAAGWTEGVNWGRSNELAIKTGSNGLTIKSHGDTTINGNLDVGGMMDTTKINLTNEVWDNFPSAITNNGDNWFQGEYVANANDVGCLFKYKTSGSATYWWSGVPESNTNGFNIWFNYQGLSLKSNGGAVLSDSLTQNPDASLKDNVEDVGLTDCMNMLGNIHAKTYTRNDMEEGNKRLGFIAQDVKAYLPDKFDNIIGSNTITDEQGERSKEITTMDHARMVCVLWKTVQNQNERTKALEPKKNQKEI